MTKPQKHGRINCFSDKFIFIQNINLSNNVKIRNGIKKKKVSI